MKQILLIGNDSDGMSILKKLNPKFKIKKTKNLKIVDEIISTSKPDFVLCAGKIKMNEEGRYYLEI